MSHVDSIPAQWSKRRLRFDAYLNPLKSRLDLPPDTEVSFVPMDAVGELGGLAVNETKAIEEVYNGYTYFADGDVVIAKITPCFENGKGALAYGLTNGVAFGTTELHVIRPKSGLDARFLFYLTIANDFRSFGEAEMLGAGGQKRVPEEFLKDWRAPLPPLEIQRRIARFLDEKTARIDGLIEKKRALLNRLAEKRQALITRAVTRGLNPDAPIKPSGIDWLGDIPAHWEAANLRWLTHQIKTGPFGAQLSSAEFVDDEIPVINPSDILDGKIIANRHNTVTAETAERLVAYRMRPNDIVFARRGEMGRCALVREEQDGWLCGTGCIVVTPDVNILHPRFTEFFLGSQFSQEWFSLNSVGATMANLNEEILGLFPITVPPVYEQIAIGEYLDRSLEYEDNRTIKVQQSVKLLEDYRAALITAAVTGKISELQ